MIVYDGTKTEFLSSVERGVLADEVASRVLSRMGRHTGKSEFDSWQNSMMHMHMVLSDTAIPDDAGVAIEYNIPQTSKRVDLIISGYDANEHPNAVIVELKQWSEVEKIDGPDALVNTFTGGAHRTVVHPSYQVWSYASLIKDYNQNVQDKLIDLAPCTFLHNYKLHDNDPILAEQYQPYIEEAPVFVKGDTYKLREFIKKCIKTGDNKEILYEIDNGKIRPSKSLQNSIASMLRGNKEFIMIDDQKVAYEKILETAIQSMDDDKKRTLIVQGGPGTGKSVIAINLLAELTKRGQFVQYASKNSAPRAVYAQKLRGARYKKASIDNLFKGTGMYTEAPNGAVHTILVDEAHRMNDKSGMFHNLGENQIKEVIHAAHCSVFFIDESQRVTMNDIGSVAEIQKWAEYEHSEVSMLELKSQFRCNGSDGYLAWLDDTLEIRETGNYSLEDIDYDIRVLDSPNEVRKLIVERNNIDHRSRMLAGYCWDWIKDGKNDTNVYDIEIDDFKMSWNLGNSIFAIDDSSIDQIGCIHTSQGLEFDYAGVIIGDDMRFDGEHIVTDYTKRAKTDQSMKGIKKLAKANPAEAKRRGEEIIKNTYRTLMTRGMKGCYIYCTDRALSDYLKQRLSVGK